MLSAGARQAESNDTKINYFDDSEQSYKKPNFRWKVQMMKVGKERYIIAYKTSNH